jgi:AcrR family transcriptional regulator
MREQILDGTERLLGRLGYQKTTMDDIALEAGVGRRSIYLHFDSKEAVALGTIDRIVSRLLERLENLAAAEESASARIRSMLAERVLFRFDSVRGYFHSIDEIFRSLRSAYMARRASYFQKEAAVFAKVLLAGRAAGELEIRDPEACAQALLIATNALLPSSLSTRELGRRSEVEGRVQQIAELLVNGMMPRKGLPKVAGQASRKNSVRRPTKSTES